MTITVEKSRLNNQSILQNFALVEELDEQAAEIISGGDKVTIENKTGCDILFRLDGKQTAQMDLILITIPLRKRLSQVLFTR